MWMDDFGSGYSSLDVLQNIRFDLIKFDMRFMDGFDSGEEGKIILTEMDELRSWTDRAEAIIPDEYLPYPTYEKMLFSLR